MIKRIFLSVVLGAIIAQLLLIAYILASVPNSILLFDSLMSPLWIILGSPLLGLLLLPLYWPLFYAVTTLLVLLIIYAGERQIAKMRLSRAEWLILQQGSSRRYATSAIVVFITGILITAMMVIGTKQREPVDLIVESDHVGRIIVFYDVKDGSPTKYVNNHRIYEVPTNRILYSQFTAMEGKYQLKDHRYFLKEPSGALRRIDGGYWGDFNDQIKVDTTKPCTLVYDIYYIGAHAPMELDGTDPLMKLGEDKGVKCVDGVLLIR